MTTTALIGSSNAVAQETPFLLDQVTITTTKTETLVIDSLSGSSVVTRDVLDRFEASDTNDIFRGVPGVTTQSDGNDPNTAINIRGIQDFGRVNVLIEGARQNFQRSGHGANGVFYLEPELIKQVDITRGPVSTIFGSGAIGGVVNFELIDAVDLLSDDETVAGKQKTSFETNDTGVLSSTTFALRPAENLDLLANFTFRRDDDFSDGSGRTLPDTGERLLNGLFKAKLTPTEGHELEFIASHQNGVYETGDTDFAAGFLRETDTDVTNIIGKYSLDGSSPLLNLSSSIYYTDTNTDQLQLEENPNVPNSLGAERFFNVQTIGYDVFNTSEFATGALDHQFTFGADGFVDLVETDDEFGTGDEFTPSGRRGVFGGFIQNQINYSTWLEVIGALRFDHFDLDSGENGLSGSDVSPKITVGVTPFEGIQFFGTYAEGFRAPAVTEVFNSGVHDPAFPFVFLPNFDLEPETAQNFEGGVNLKFDEVFRGDDRFRAKIVGFQNTVENFIEGDVRGSIILPPAPFGPPIPIIIDPGVFQFINIAEARIRGVEVEATYETDRFYANLAYSRIRGDDTLSDQPLESIRPDEISATIGAFFLENTLNVGGRVTHVQQQDRLPILASDGSPNTLVGLQGDPHTIIDLFASYEPNENARFSVVLNNITNQEFTRYLDVNASEGFSAVLSATFKLGR